MPTSRASDGQTQDEDWLHAVFDRHDLNRDGRLTLGEFIRLITWLDVRVTTEQCEVAFDRADLDQRGSIAFDSFYRWWVHRDA